MKTATHRAYLTAKGQIVPEGDLAAASLLVGVGQPVPAEHQEAYDAFVKSQPKVKAEPEPEPEVEADDDVEEKAEAPSENKAITKAPKNKRR